MISDDKVHEIELLLQAGKLSQRAIIRKSGIGPHSFDVLQNRQHRYYLRPNALPQPVTPLTLIPPYGPYVLCPGCGGTVQMPCLCCYINNGNKYPSDVWEAYKSMPTLPETKCCMKCRKHKPISEFGELDSNENVYMNYHACRSCRNKATHWMSATEEHKMPSDPQSVSGQRRFDVRSSGRASQ